MAFLIRFVIIPIAVFLLLRFILRTLSSADRSGKIMAEEAGFACAVFSALGHVLEGKENVPRERLLRQVLGIIAAAESSGGSGKRERIPAVRAIENDGSLCRALMALYAEGALPGRELSLDAGTVRGSRRGVFLHAIASALIVSEKGEGWQRRFADVAGALGISAREAALGSGIPEFAALFDTREGTPAEEETDDGSSEGNGGTDEFWRRFRSPLTYDEAFLILGITPDADLKAARRSYLRLARRYHPDALRNKGLSEEQIRLFTERFRLVAEAWEIVRNYLK